VVGQSCTVHPGVLRLLDLKPGEPVADVACGQGALARLLQARGAEVTGVDAAPELIRAARERGPEAIRYHVADARELSFLPEGTFAAAACVLAIQNIQPIAPVFEGVARLLRPGGRFVLAMMHPDVVWPNGMEGGTVVGHAAVRAYWTRQWGLIDPRVEPRGFAVEADGRVAVAVHQVVRDLTGTVLKQVMVQLVYAFAGGLITSMEIRA